MSYPQLFINLLKRKNNPISNIRYGIGLTSDVPASPAGRQNIESNLGTSDVDHPGSPTDEEVSNDKREMVHNDD